MINDQYYNLISRFVDCNPTSGISTATLCMTCKEALDSNKIPTYSLANGVDYGDALALGLEELTIPEQYLVALGRVYGTVLKLTGNQNEERQAAFTGHVITFPQPSEILLAEIAKLNSNSIDSYPNVTNLQKFVSVVFVGARQQWDSFVPTPYSKIPEIQVNPAKIFRHLRVLKALHPAYKNIVIDDSEEMTRSLSDIPQQLLLNAEIVDGEMEQQMDKLVQQECEDNNEASDDITFPELPTVFMTHSAPPPTNVDAPAHSIFKSNCSINDEIQE